MENLIFDNSSDYENNYTIKVKNSVIIMRNDIYSMIIILNLFEYDMTNGKILKQ